MQRLALLTALAASPPQLDPEEPSAVEPEAEEADATPGDAEPEVMGCTKDTDCKGDRICDAASGRCQSPEPTVAQPPVPQVRDDPPPTWYRSGPVRTHHPYVPGGVTMILLGTAGIATGGAWLGIFKKNLDAAAGTTSADFEEYSDLTTRAPKVYAGTGILISSGGVLLITGIILAAIEEPVRVAVSPSPGSLTIRF